SSNAIVPPSLSAAEQSNTGHASALHLGCQAIDGLTRTMGVSRYRCSHHANSISTPMTRDRVISVISVPVTVGALLAGNLAGEIIGLVWVAVTKTPWSNIGFVRWPNWLRDATLAVAGGVALKILLKSVVLPPLGVPPVNAAYQFLIGNGAALL